MMKENWRIMSEKLKPCKCKNNKPDYFVRFVKYSPNPEHIYVCKKCGHFGIGYTEEEAVEVWNKRS